MDIKKKSKVQEKKVAKELKGKTTPASGSIAGMKGDVRTSKILVECKYTDKDFYKLKKQVWEKIKKEALKDNLKIPLLQINIQDYRVAILDKNDFISLIGDFLTINELKLSGEKEITLKLKDLKEKVNDLNCYYIPEWGVYIVKYDRDFTELLVI